MVSGHTSTGSLTALEKYRKQAAKPLSAGNSVDIVAATNTDTSWRFKETKKSGLMGTGGIGFTIGSSRSTHDLREQGTTQSGSFSTVGSTGGDVSITAATSASRRGNRPTSAGQILSPGRISA